MLQQNVSTLLPVIMYMLFSLNPLHKFMDFCIDVRNSKQVAVYISESKSKDRDHQRASLWPGMVLAIIETHNF